ncbi:hypothetical protein Y1Q_0016859 [Alligator mississippiensis]|uniref:DDE Tnp4 domain-containing protein n=1 Tax=Alligator mississippiensis TaxID=8496 RepID=A0A151P701_ALLMI|nr:hypothetical protein Y1Q_0016859 [Alligator mississippiensis]
MCPAPPDNTDLAVALLKLATPTSLQYVGHLFDVVKATARKAVLEVCGTLQDVLADTIIHVHDPHVVVVGFHELGFPQCTRVLDGNHILVTCPPHGEYPYYTLRGFQSMDLQAVVVHQGMFTHVSTGWVGITQDTHMFQNSGLAMLVANGCFAPGVAGLHLGSIVIPP